ncbi:lysophospholipid acyltransferase family protein [Curvivirga aplysinae]|uniref:lysophospholipid acyltransferase family protein n=1 Tax=Curvivirga aplysinae TaxID=2529852 RepID=UPI0012BC416F|nr:lysophospholipid acyltransferase family protein [Curvivirga aplysinae]MTI08821.1 1-acyl-sn-glycerol-3-phosphate acyltransferase [Curvivirga aplysinae]
MIAIRSFLFLILFYVYMAMMCIIGLPFLLLPRKFMRHMAKFWLGGCLVLTKYVVGINYRVIGQENLPEGSVIIAAKHQSAWETLAMHYLNFDSAYVLKKELLSIPLFGRYLSKMNCVAVDRKAGASALKEMVTQSRIVLDNNRSLVIFPQGTRTAPGEDRPYHPGIAGLYTQNNTAVVPVALNSGQFWGRNAFKKVPGTITVEYLEPIEPGLPRREFMNLLKERIETANKRIEDDVIQERGF